MRSFAIYIYNSFKCGLFYEMDRQKLEKCWFHYYYDYRDFGMFHFKATGELRGYRPFNIDISIDKFGYKYYYDELVDIFKSHEDCLFEIGEYDLNMDTFDIIFTKPIYAGSEKEVYRVSRHGSIKQRYNIDYRAVYIDDDTRAWIDKAAYDNLAVNNARSRLTMNSVYGLYVFNPIRDITINEIREQLQLPVCKELPTFKFGIAPTLSKPPIFNPPATICYWTDGTKTVVKCQEGDSYSPESGLALCYMKKVLGNTSRDLNKELHKYIPEEKEENNER